MSWFVIYLIACTVLWVFMELNSWYKGTPVTLKELAVGFLLSYTPLINLISLYFAIKCLLDSKIFNFKILKGRRRE